MPCLVSALVSVCLCRSTHHLTGMAPFVSAAPITSITTGKPPSGRLLAQPPWLKLWQSAARVASCHHKNQSKTPKLTQYADFLHTSPVIVQIIDKLSSVCNKIFQEHTNQKDTHSINFKYQIDQVMKLLYFLEAFSYNKLNLVSLHTLNADKTLISLLKSFNSINEKDIDTSEVECQIMMCIAVCLRS